MTRLRQLRRVDAATVAPLIVMVDGCKTIKDTDLAALFGVSLPVFYRRLGRKLWMLTKDMYFKLTPRYARGRLDAQPALAFTQTGVIMIASIFGDDDSLEIGMDIVQALKSRRRGSAHKQRPGRRKIDAEKAARYYEAMARMLQGRLHDMLKKMRH